MASNIDPTLNGYNPLFPVAGVAQSSQGFRNNFTSIQQNLYTAKSELSTIQNKTFSTSSTSDLLISSPSDFMVPGQEDSPVLLDLRFKPNPTFTGTGAITVTQGSQEERPPNPINGMLRYNTTTNCMEFFINSSWVTLGGGTSSSIFNTTGGTLTGDLILDDPTGVAQVLADHTYNINEPSYSFDGDTSTGIGHPSQGEISIITNGSPRIVISENSINLTPNAPATRATVTMAEMGFLQAKEGYFCLKNRQTNEWHTIATMDVGANPIMVISSFDIKYSCSSTNIVGSTLTGFIITGNTMGSYAFFRRVIEVQNDISTIPIFNITDPVQYDHNNSFGVVGEIEYGIFRDGSVISLQAKCTTTNQTFTLSGKVMLSFDHHGMTPITFSHDV